MEKTRISVSGAGFLKLNFKTVVDPEGEKGEIFFPKLEKCLKTVFFTEFSVL